MPRCAEELVDMKKLIKNEFTAGSLGIDMYVNNCWKNKYIAFQLFFYDSKMNPVRLLLVLEPFPGPHDAKYILYGDEPGTDDESGAVGEVESGC